MVDLLLGTPAVLPLRDRLIGEGGVMHAPHLIDLEVAQAVRRFVLRGDLTLQEGTEALEIFKDMRILRYSHVALLPRIWELRSTLTAYDAAYIALAELLDAPLLTRDGRLARATGHRASVELV